MKSVTEFASSITVIVPAHNEEKSLPATLVSLKGHGFGRILVASDNSTDKTIAVALAHGVDVLETVGNTARKAGALNQALSVVLPLSAVDDFIFVVDADTTLSGTFVPAAWEVFQSDDSIAAVGGVFQGEEPTNLLELCQVSEYARFAREVERTHRTMVLSGTSSLVKASALIEVAQSRGGALPGLPGDVYKRDAITEDCELSIALKTLGHRLASPEACSVSTEVMPTVKMLHRQRVRWYRGALESLATYGLSRVTARYWFQQVMLGWGSLMFALMLIVVSISIGLNGFTTSPLWMCVTLIFVAERVVTIWRRGTWEARIIAAILIPELIYTILLYIAFVDGAIAAIAGKKHQWHHVEPKQKESI